MIEQLAFSHGATLVVGTPTFMQAGSDLPKLLTEAGVTDDAMINAHTLLQTHLFEDRVMKLSTLTIGRCCTVGNGSVVLYDTEMRPYSMLGNL